ncbi:MAG: AAA family ATPase, partial [Thermoleophilia bacterium]|nr:AAA family ATPase [Thermoleophilia bacterium]
MIVRVSIDNLVIVDHAEFEPGPQLTAVTGETGAGKTLLATAIGLLFGADAEGAQVGIRGDHAWVEGEFELSEALWSDPALEVFTQLRPEPDAPLVLARKISDSGRSRALAWGRTISKTDLAAAGRLLVASAGQHAGRRLVSPAWQRSLVDKAGDAAHETLLGLMQDAHAGVVAAHADHVRVNEAAARIGERAEAVLDDLSRIDGVQPSLDDFAELRTQRDRARNHAALHEALATAYTAVADDESPVSSNIGRAVSELITASGWDPTLEPLAAQMSDLQQGLASVASDVRGRLDELRD